MDACVAKKIQLALLGNGARRSKGMVKSLPHLRWVAHETNRVVASARMRHVGTTVADELSSSVAKFPKLESSRLRRKECILLFQYTHRTRTKCLHSFPDSRQIWASILCLDIAARPHRVRSAFARVALHRWR